MAGESTAWTARAAPVALSSGSSSRVGTSWSAPGLIPNHIFNGNSTARTSRVRPATGTVGQVASTDFRLLSVFSAGTGRLTQFNLEVVVTANADVSLWYWDGTYWFGDWARTGPIPDLRGGAPPTALRAPSTWFAPARPITCLAASAKRMSPEAPIGVAESTPPDGFTAAVAKRGVRQAYRCAHGDGDGAKRAAEADTIDKPALAQLLEDHPMRLHGFLRDQRITRDQHIAFARVFGVVASRGTFGAGPTPPCCRPHH